MKSYIWSTKGLNELFCGMVCKVRSLFSLAGVMLEVAHVILVKTWVLSVLWRAYEILPENALPVEPPLPPIWSSFKYSGNVFSLLSRQFLARSKNTSFFLGIPSSSGPITLIIPN